MPHDLTFSVLHDYGTSDDGIVVPVTLSTGTESIEFTARVDTGSTFFCIFKRAYAEMLGVDTETGLHVRIGTVTGGFDAYGHMLTLKTLGYSFDVMVYFAKKESFTRNVLGRRGWLNQVRLALVEYEGKLYLSKYDEADALS